VDVAGSMPLLVMAAAAAGEARNTISAEQFLYPTATIALLQVRRIAAERLHLRLVDYLRARSDAFIL
jgi:hypothetical protein